MSKAETAENLFESYNCAQSVLAAFAGDYGLDKEKALQLAAGFGAGMGRLQETCGAVNGVIMVLGLNAGLKEGDSKEKTHDFYTKVRRLVGDFTAQKGTVRCRDLLGGCNLLSEDGQKFFKEHNLKNNCREYVRLCCELLDKYLKSSG